MCFPCHFGLKARRPLIHEEKIRELVAAVIVWKNLFLGINTNLFSRSMDFIDGFINLRYRMCCHQGKAQQ